MEFVALLKDLGVPVSWALVIWLIWRGEQREKRITARLANLEIYFRDKLSTTLDRSTRQIGINTAALQQTNHALRQSNDILARVKHA